MSAPGVWEKIYLHCLEIHELEAENVESLRVLCEHLSSIDILIPEGIEPDTDFELCVVAKLCRYVETLLSAGLKNNLL